MAIPPYSGRRGPVLPPSPPSASGPPGLEPEQGDERLGVVALRDGVVQPVQRPGDALNPLVLLGLSAGGRPELAGLVQPHPLVAEARAGVDVQQLRPPSRLETHLLRELALRGPERRLAGDVELAGRDLKRGGGTDDLP